MIQSYSYEFESRLKLAHKHERRKFEFYKTHNETSINISQMI